MIDRLIAPEFKEITDFNIIKAQTSRLDNGIPFHIVQAGNEPVVRLEVIFNSGHWYEPTNGVSYFTTKLLSAGTSKYSSKQIEAQIAQYGAFLDLVTGHDRCTITIYALSKHLEKILPLLYEMITDPVFPDTEVENLKKISSQNLKVNLKKTSYLATIHFRELMFGKEHPYGRTLNEEAIDRISSGILKKYHKEKFTSKNCEIILAGNGSENFLQLINNYFGSSDWGTFIDTEPNIKNTPLTEKSTLVKIEDSVQSSIRMGIKAITLNHPDYFKLNLLTEIYGGYFGSRLMKNIREEKGYTYGINACLNCLKHEGYLAIGTDVNKENTSNTINEIVKEMNIVKSEPVSTDELKTITNYLLGTFMNSLSTPFGLADKFKTIHFNGLDYSFYDQQTISLKTLTPVDLLETANKYYNESNLLEVVVGDK